MTAPTVTLECVIKGKGQRAALYLVIVNGAVVGQLEKIRDTRTDRHPWKAYSGTGQTRRYLGAFYAGKSAALDAVLAAR